MFVVGGAVNIGLKMHVLATVNLEEMTASQQAVAVTGYLASMSLSAGFVTKSLATIALSSTALQWCLWRNK